MAKSDKSGAGNFELVVGGLGFLEGPMAMNDGSVIFTDMKARCLTRVTPDGTVSKVADVPGGANGAAIGPDGAIYIANKGGMEFETVDGRHHSVGVHGKNGGAIDRVDIATGQITRLYTEGDGRKLRAPNDLVFDRSGGFWFTDLGSIDFETLDWGALYYAKADGSFITCEQQGRGLVTPNGIGLSADEQTVYTAETLTGRVWAFPVETPGKFVQANGMAARRPLGMLPVFEALDSLAVDSEGWVCAGALVVGGIACFHPDGRTAIVPAPRNGITNICFGGADMRDVWITAGHAGEVYKGRWDVPGLKLAYYA
jgi:gluconolactonase